MNTKKTPNVCSILYVQMIKLRAERATRSPIAMSLPSGWHKFFYGNLRVSLGPNGLFLALKALNWKLPVSFKAFVWRHVHSIEKLLRIFDYLKTLRKSILKSSRISSSKQLSDFNEPTLMSQFEESLKLQKPFKPSLFHYDRPWRSFRRCENIFLNDTFGKTLTKQRDRIDDVNLSPLSTIWRRLRCWYGSEALAHN